MKTELEYHNPQNLQSPGEYWRFLIKNEPCKEGDEFWDERLKGWCVNQDGWLLDHRLTYRTNRKFPTLDHLPLQIQVEWFKAALVEDIVVRQALEVEALNSPFSSLKGLNAISGWPMESYPTDIQDRVIKLRKDRYGIE